MLFLLSILYPYHGNYNQYWHASFIKHKLVLPLFLDVTDEPVEIGENKGGKIVTKASIAKKILKKNIQANQKTLFDEEGQATIDGLSQKKSQEGQVMITFF